MTGELVLDNVRKSFSGHTVLDGLSTTIPLTGVTFVVGKSGSGKSVVCRLAVGLLKPDGGAVTLLGQRVDELPERKLQALRAKVPYLVQGPALLDWLTLEDNVAMTSKGAKQDGRARAALTRVGLGGFADRLPTQLGPGIKKRAAIARALVLEPTCLVLDEPTTGLDREAAGQVNAALQELRSQGLGAIVVSHDYGALSQLADRVVEVASGRTAFVGTAAAFLEHRQALFSNQVAK